MEWYEHDLAGPSYDGPAYAQLLMRLVGYGIGLAVIMAAGGAW